MQISRDKYGNKEGQEFKSKASYYRHLYGMAMPFHFVTNCEGRTYALHLKPVPNKKVKAINHWEEREE